MANRAALLGITVVTALSASQASAQSNYCSTYGALLTPGALYVALPCATDPSKVCPTFADTAPLKKNIAYHFLYKTQATDILNSLIVIHVKGIATQPITSPTPVKLTRQRLSFACKSRTEVFSKPSYRDQVNNDTRLREVPYDSYDLFNRYGYAPKPISGTLIAFHTNYFNGAACVSTLEPSRRAEFLFTDQDDVPGFLVSTATRLGFKTAPAIAASINQYNYLHVIVANYKKQPETSGCVSFTAHSTDNSVQIDLSDLEEKVQVPGLFKRRNWTLSTQ